MDTRLSLSILITLLVIFQPDPINADEAKEVADAEPPVEVHVIPMLSLKSDLRTILKAKEHFVELCGSEDGADAAIFEVVSMGGEISETLLLDDNPLRMIYDISFTQPTFTMVADMVVPTGEGVLEEILGTEETEEGVTDVDGVVTVDGGSAIISERYLALRQLGGNIFVKDTAAQLRQLLKDVESRHQQKTFTISAHPRKFGRSALKPTLTSMRATLLTQAQERDNDDPLSSMSRAFLYKSFATWFDAFFDDTERLELVFDYSESERTSSVELILEAAKGSPLDQYIGRLSKVRSRSLSYLHPDHEAFGAFSIPLPELLTDILPQLSSNSLQLLQKELGMTETPNAAVVEVIRQLANRAQLDLLTQVVQLPEGGRTVVFVMPLDAASALEPTSIQLVSGLYGSHWEMNFGEVGGYSLHRLDGQQFGLLAGALGGADCDVYFVMTEHCVAIAIGGEESLDVFENVITRDFDSAASASRFARSAFAMQFPASVLTDLEMAEQPAGITTRLNDDEDAPVHDNVTFALNTAPQQLTITATFEPDALITALTSHELCIDVLSAGIEAFDE